MEDKFLARPNGNLGGVRGGEEGGRIDGNFIGSNLAVDPVTGFLDILPGMIPGQVGGYGVGPAPLFVASKKVEFLKNLTTLWPHFANCAKSVGVSRDTFKNHYQIDIVFRAAVDEIVEKCIDDVEDVRVKIAMTKGGALDRMAVLNSYRKSIYNPDQTLTIKHEMSRDEATARAARLRECVDTEIVDTYDKIKATNRGKRKKELNQIRDRG